jgi:RNA polymerase subunit RPABC4/transcription elongation factor Spt4
MKKQNPIYLFSAIMSLGVAGFVFFMLVSGFGIQFFMIAIPFFIVIVIFFMSMANKLTSNSFGSRLQKEKECRNCNAIIPKDSDFCPKCGTNTLEILECDYCGHINKIDSIICEKCNGIIG